MIQAVIFDCFGVIYPDTLYLATRKFLDVNDKAMSKRINAIRSRCDRGLMSRDEFWDEVAKTLQISKKTLDTELDKVRGADWELLEYIKNLKTRCKTAMLSNVGKGFLERIFDDEHPQSGYFDVVVASGDTGYVKPDKRAYEYVAMQLNVDPKHCVMVDDLRPNCDGAEVVGMSAIFYEGYHSFQQQLEKLLIEKS